MKRSGRDGLRHTGEVRVASIVWPTIGAQPTPGNGTIVDAGVLPEVVTFGQLHARAENIDGHRQVLWVAEKVWINERRIEWIRRTQPHRATTTRPIDGVEHVKVSIVVQHWTEVVAPSLRIGEQVGHVVERIV